MKPVVKKGEDFAVITTLFTGIITGIRFPAGKLIIPFATKS
jgi:hypothetical protein